MKQLKLLPAFLLLALQVIAQSADPSMIAIHEDKVLIDKSDTYWNTAAELKKTLETNKITGIRYWAFRGDDGSVSYVSPMSNFAELDKNMWKELTDKIGEESFNKMMSGFAGCYLTHEDFVINYHPDKSYAAETLTDKDVYREMFYYYLYEDKADDYFKALDEWKAAFTGVNSPMGYQIYSNGFGMNGPVVMVMTWGENENDQEQAYLKTYADMKAKWDELWKKSQACVYKIEKRRFWFAPELTYFPEE
jgi:hypothetical protein